MSLYEFLKENFLDSCSNSMHNLEERRKIINSFKKEIKDFNDLLNEECKSLKHLENKS
tara:strand:+ start:120 stop:293 length:174 start_codon:yes stop_codon:yes gene_type:complete